jgi:Glycosyl hydrolase family 26
MDLYVRTLRAYTQHHFLPRGLMLIALLSSLLLVAGCARGGQEAEESTSHKEYCSGSVALGSFIKGVTQDPTKIDEYTDMVGTPPAIVAWYQDWAPSSAAVSMAAEFDQATMEAATTRGAMPMVTWEPQDPTRGKDNKQQLKYAPRTIAAGEHDDYIRQWARGAAEWGKPMYIRFAHEMNSFWYPWAVGVHDNTSADYVAAWRHIVDLFRQEGATNVQWVWSPDVSTETSPSLEEIYPGDDYVDWIALDGYNWGTTQSWSRWQTLAEVLGPDYDKLVALAPSKPFMIAEVGSAEEGGDKASWIRDAFGTDIPTRLPATKAVVWFDSNKTDKGETDWQIDSSRSSLAAYSEVAASPAYQCRLI